MVGGNRRDFATARRMQERRVMRAHRLLTTRISTLLETHRKSLRHVPRRVEGFRQSANSGVIL